MKKPRLFWCAITAAVSLFLSAIHTIAAPANDAFSTAIVLPAGLPTIVAGSNIDATTEASEPLLPLVRRTVWWSWTPTSSSWVRVATEGTNIDTFLTAFTGPTLGDIGWIAFNDESGGIFDVPGPSELIFFATAGKTYFLQVGGFASWSGAFLLHLTAIKAPPQLASLSFTPQTIDVSAQESSLTFDLKATHPAGLRQGRLTLYRPDGTLEYDTGFNAVSRISGNSTSGTYRVTATVRQKAQPGSYSLRIGLVGNDSRSAVYGERTPFPVGITHYIPIVNTGIVDADPPQILLFTATPATLDVTTAAKTTRLTARMADIVSGVFDFASRLDVLTPAGDAVGGDTFSRRNRTAGDNFDGTYFIDFTVPTGAMAGDYPFRFRLIDALGNDVIYGPNSEAGELPVPVGLPDHLTVVNTGIVDILPPTLTAASISPATVNVAESELLNLTLSVQDARSGVETVELADAFGLRPVSGGAIIPLSFSLTRTGGSANNGTWQGSAGLPTTLAPGDYLVVGIHLADALGNEVTYGPASLGLTNYPSGINPIVTIISKPLDGPYKIWLKNYPELTDANARPEADPDGDGLANLIEMALGTHPLIRSVTGSADPKAANAPHIRRSDNRLYMDYTVVSANLGTGSKTVQVNAEESTDLQSWSGAQKLILGSGSASAFISVSTTPSKFLRLIVYDPASYP